MDFTVIARAGLTQVEFSLLAGVNRVTANMWVRGKMSPHKYIRAKVQALLALLEEALTHELLPVGVPVSSKEDKLVRVRDILREVSKRPAS